jgi:hypothetical protein
MPVLRHSRVFELGRIRAARRTGREEPAAFLVELDARATRFADKRDRAQARSAERAHLARLSAPTGDLSGRVHRR